MSQPIDRPDSDPKRLRRPRVGWLAAGIAALLAVAIGLVGFQLGRRLRPADIWDPIWLRAYLNRPKDHTQPTNGFWVSGYYVDYDSSSLETVQAQAPNMDQVVLFSYGFDQDGTVTGREPFLIQGLTGQEKRVLLFGNVDASGFNQKTVHAILTDPNVQQRAIQGIVSKATDLPVAGVQIDFENIPGEDRDAYTAFLRKLKDVLQPHHLTLSIAAAAKTYDAKDGWGGATDYMSIGKIVDYIYIMAYDEHGSWGEPGPVASLPWTEAVIRYAIGVMPSQKIVLGVPFYGYEWSANAKPEEKSNRAYGAEQLKKRSTENSAVVKWDEAIGENVATFKTSEGDRIAWWPDERSLDLKLKLAFQYNLKGIALWRLGFEPEAWWTQLSDFRSHPQK